MKCMECGEEMMTETVQGYPYVEAGVEGVFLSGIKVSRCRNRHEEVAIPRLEELHQRIALSLARRSTRLRGNEVRFLRKYLGFSGVDFAPIMGVKPETVSRWENEKESVGPTAERLLRMLVQRLSPIEEYPIERLAEVGRDSAEPPVMSLSLRSGKSGWQLERAA